MLTSADLDPVVRRWIGLGASACVVTAADGEFTFPDGASPIGTPAVAQIEIGDGQIARVEVYGLEDVVSVHRRLTDQMELFRAVVEARTAAARAIAQLGGTTERFSALLDLAGAGSGSFDTTVVLDRIVREAARLTKADSVFVALDGDASGVVVYPDIIDSAELRTVLELIGPGTEVHTDVRFERHDGRVADVLAVELRTQDGRLGIVGFVNPPDGSADPNVVWIGLAVAGHTAAALSRMRLHAQIVAQARLAQEYEIAAEVQESLVPLSMRQAPGLDVGAAYAQSLSVGGDFYDWVLRPDGSVVATAGDVSGKGMSAALVMSMTQMLTRSAVEEGFVSPAHLAERLNRNLHDQLTAIGAFVTMFFAHLDPASDVIRFVNAGHSPVILNTPAHPSAILSAGGPPLGVLPNLDMELRSFEFTSGSWLVACSDGIVEQRNGDGEMFGYDRLFDLLHDADARGAQGLADQIASAVESFAGGAPVDDDRTVLVAIRRDEHE